MSSPRKVSPSFSWVVTWSSVPGLCLLIQPSEKDEWGLIGMTQRGSLTCIRECNTQMAMSLQRNQSSFLAIANLNHLIWTFIMSIQAKRYLTKGTLPSIESKVSLSLSFVFKLDGHSMVTCCDRDGLDVHRISFRFLDA